MTVTAHGTAFVAGATGYTGNAVVAELRARGTPVVAHVRPDSPSLAEWRRRFEALGAVVDTTPWQERELAATLARVQPSVVFALLGTTRRRMRESGSHDSYESVDYGLTAMLLRAVRTSAPDARFVYLSAIGVGPKGRGSYMHVRWRLEEELRASGVDWMIARPAVITGDRAEPRALERVMGTAIDMVLKGAAVLGARRLHERYASMTAAVLARGLVHHAYSPSGSCAILGPAQLRSVA